MQKSTFIYSLVAKRGGSNAVVVLAEHTAVNGTNGPLLAVRIVENIKPPGNEL